MESLSSIKLLTKNDYRKVLKDYLSVSDFQNNNKDLIKYTGLIVLYFFTIKFLTSSEIVALKFVTSIALGILLSCLTFFLHDLMHGSIIKSNKLAYIIGLSIGVFNLFPPFFWKRLHTYHHARTGQDDDPDRNWILNEKPTKPHEVIIYKLRMSNECYNKLFSFIFIAFGFIAYFMSNIYFGVLSPKSSENSSIKYRKIQKLFNPMCKFYVLCELSIIFLVQVYLFTIISRFSFLNFFFISLLPILIAHFTTMIYIHTNHIFSPLTGKIDDPLINSVSIKNSKLIDKLFFNFSHHVEHHLYPSMASEHYPKVRKLLLKFFPERFQLLTMTEAVEFLFNTPRIYATADTLVGLSSNKTFPCVLPKST